MCIQGYLLLMKIIITESQYEIIKKMVFDYLNSYDWVTKDDTEYHNMTRLYVRGKEEYADDAMFEAYNFELDDEDETESGRMLLIRPVIWDTVHKMFGIPHSELKPLFMEWYNNYTGEECTTADRM